MVPTRNPLVPVIISLIMAINAPRPLSDIYKELFVMFLLLGRINQEKSLYLVPVYQIIPFVFL